MVGGTSAPATDSVGGPSAPVPAMASGGTPHAWGIGEFLGGQLEVEGHDPVAMMN